MKNFSFVVLLLLAFSGCSRQLWTAKFFVFKAEGLLSKAANLKSKKVPYQERIPYYRQACVYYLEAYHHDPGVFTLSRIRDATDACWRSENQSAQEEFVKFEEAYAKRHPKEYEYGDTEANLGEF